MTIEEKILKDIKFALSVKNMKRANDLRTILSAFEAAKRNNKFRGGSDYLAAEMCAADFREQGEPELSHLMLSYVSAMPKEVLVDEIADEIVNKIKGVIPLEEFMKSLTERLVEKMKTKIS